MNIKNLFSKIISCAFILVVILIFTVGFINALFFPDIISEYENRYANKIEAFTVQTYVDGSFQEKMDTALADQITLASTFKKTYNQLSSRTYRAFLQPVLEYAETNGNYLPMNSGWIFGGDTLVSYHYPPARVSDLERAAEAYNRIFTCWPDTEFFVYYVERGMDIDFSTGNKPDFCGQFFSLLELPEENMDAFSVDSFEQYRENFFATDHHWKNTGSYRGYREVLKLLGCDETPLQPMSERVLSDRFYGSYARGDLSCYNEKFTVYEFDFPAMECRVDGYESENYGNQEYYLAGNMPVEAYGKFYGLDNGEVFYSTNRPERENLLIIGDSYDNAIIRLLATHFNNTYSVDPRTYEVYLYKPFSLEHYIEICEADKVLFLGNFDTLTDQRFYLGE